MNYIEAFEVIKDLFKNADTKGLKDNCAIQVNMTDDDCNGAFYIEYKDGNLSVEPYDYIDRNALLTASFKDLKDIVSGRILITTAVAKEKAFVDGDIEVVAVIMKAAKKKPAKKAAPKKAAEKKVAPKAEAPKKVEEKKVAPAPVKKEEPKKEVKKAEAPVKKEEPKKAAPAKKTTKK